MPCCDDHEDNDAVRYTCMKHRIEVCAACARCSDPQLYCKFRPGCLIHFMEKERERESKTKSGT
jgi:hypothetical protein